MKQFYTNSLSIAAMLAVFASVSSCTSTGGTTSENSSSSTGSASANNNGKIAGKGVFSSLSELHYTPSAEGAYKISPNDLIEINVFRVEELSGKTRVDQNGRISLPLIGTMSVAGLSQQQLEKKLAQKLSQTYLQNPQVSVFVQEQTSKEITVGGRVKSAGVFPLKTATTLSQAITMAGDLSDLADPSNVVLFRPTNSGKFKAYRLDLKAIREGKLRDPYISGKDQIVAHESGSRVMMGRVLNGIRGVFSPFSF